MADYMAHSLVSDANKDVLRLSEMIEEVRLQKNTPPPPQTWIEFSFLL